PGKTAAQPELHARRSALDFAEATRGDWFSARHSARPQRRRFNRHHLYGKRARSSHPRSGPDRATFLHRANGARSDPADAGRIRRRPAAQKTRTLARRRRGCFPVVVRTVARSKISTLGYYRSARLHPGADRKSVV